MLKIAELNADKVFEVKGNSLSCVYNYDIVNRIADKKAEIINTTITKIKEKFANITELLISDLRNNLMIIEKRKNINIREIIQYDIGYEVDIKRIENNLKDKI